MKDSKGIKERVRKEIMDMAGLNKKEINDEWVKEQIEEILERESRKCYYSLEERRSIAKEVFDELRRFHMIQELIDNEEITEIMINGKNHIFIEKNGTICRWSKSFEQKAMLEDLVQKMVAGCNRTVNDARPIVDARLGDGSRVNIVLPPVAINGPIVTIRKFSKKPMTIEQLVNGGMMPGEIAEYLCKLVKEKQNIIISGGTGTGKTTFLNALSQSIPKSERVITIEDSAELQLHSIENLVRLETRNANVDGCNEVTIRDLIRTSLRMRPDRIIVGEVRGEEATDMLQAMNTGHNGSLSSGHANSAKDMILRLETMMLMGSTLPLVAIRRQIAAGIDFIVHLGRTKDHSRKLMEIVKVVGLTMNEIECQTLYEFQEDTTNYNMEVEEWAHTQWE